MRILIGLRRSLLNIKAAAQNDPWGLPKLIFAIVAIAFIDLVYIVLLREENRPWNIPDEYD